MQRLLRGHAAYIVLMLISAGLYLKSLHDGPVPVPEQPPAASVEHVSAWWPDELNAETLAQLSREHPLATALLSWLSTLLFGMAVVGVVLGGWEFWRGRAAGLWRRGTRALPAWSPGEVGRIVLLVALVISFMPFVRLAFHAWSPGQALNGHLWISGSMAFLDCFIILTVAAFAVGKDRSLRKALGLPPGPLWPGIRDAGRAYLIVFPWLFLILFLSVRIAQHLNFHPPAEPIHELVFRNSSPLALGLTVLLACVIGPVAEELLFRGVVYGALRTRIPWTAAMLASGALFSLVHTNPIGFVPIVLLGGLLAYVYERTGSIASSIAVHVAHNTLLMSMALTFRQLGLGG